MIIVKMMGQLGNQLFIYAMARSLQKQYGGKIYIDLSGLKRHYYTAQYRLDAYNLPKHIISYDLMDINPSRRRKFERTTKVFHVEQKLLRMLHSNRLNSDALVERWFRRGCYFNFSRNWYPYRTSDKEIKMVYGYFQSEKYFESVKDELFSDLQLTTELSERDREVLDSIRSSDAVGVSIRMINNFKNVQSFISTEYYLDGIKYLQNMYSGLKVFVFSDDIAATKRKISFPVAVEYVEPSSTVIGLFLLSNCRHFVLANSTFSWWGAYLSQREKKTVIMPEPWDKERNREDIYFKDCIRIPSTFSEEITP